MRSRVLSVICVILVTATVAQSRRWFAREVNCWITQKKVPATWEDAQQYCQRHGAILASPLNTQLFNYLQSLINVHNHSAAYFIGTRITKSAYLDHEVHYKSIEGRHLKDMPRAVYDAIEQLDNMQGECLAMDRHGIRAVSCKNRLPYICYSNETTECGSVSAAMLINSSSVSPQSKSSNLPTIPPGYKYQPATRSYYKFHKSEVSWYEASAICVSEGAYLVVLDDEKEKGIIERILKSEISSNSGSHNNTWTWRGLGNSRLGGMRIWRVVNGEPVSEVYNAWYEPLQSEGGGQSCASLYNKVFLAMTSCGEKQNFICEISQ